MRAKQKKGLLHLSLSLVQPLAVTSLIHRVDGQQSLYVAVKSSHSLYAGLFKAMQCHTEPDGNSKKLNIRSLYK